MTPTPPLDIAARSSIRSYVLRKQRMTTGQRRAIEQQWPKYGLELQSILDWQTIFGRSAPVVLEIGSGKGDLITQMAASHPAKDFVAVEVYLPGIGALLRKANELALDNLRVIREDAMSLVAMHLPERSLAEVWILFPDPWRKKRHHKRRLIQKEFIEALVSKIADGGYLHLATDWGEYAQSMRATMASEPRCQRSDLTWKRPQSVFEKRAVAAGLSLIHI